MSIAAYFSRRMLEHYSHIHTEAKRVALDAIAAPVLGGSGHKTGRNLYLVDEIEKPAHQRDSFSDGY
ncbi:MAG TPA: hypothetical protein VOA41_14135 [Candidatus Dormibacteraeota bacterium]|nr:hypothetical protein [Candidatus Dormibacteraeota bacterium]HXN23873.1 hypothetical protein [Candidatus Dormibacteraeota bacterium]